MRGRLRNCFLAVSRRLYIYFQCEPGNQVVKGCKGSREKGVNLKGELRMRQNSGVNSDIVQSQISHGVLRGYVYPFLRIVLCKKADLCI